MSYPPPQNPYGGGYPQTQPQQPSYGGQPSYGQPSYGGSYPQQPQYSQPSYSQPTASYPTSQMPQQQPQSYYPQSGPGFSQPGPGYPMQPMVQHKPVTWISQYQSYAPMDEVRSWFSAVDVNRNGWIDVREVQRALELAGELATPGMVSYMMRMFDVDNNGVLDFQEFSQLIGFLRRSRQVFSSYHTNSLDFNGLYGGMGQMFEYVSSPQAVPLVKNFSSSLYKPGSSSYGWKRFLKMALALGFMNTSYEHQGSTQQYGMQPTQQYGMQPTQQYGMQSTQQYGGNPMLGYFNTFMNQGLYKKKYNYF